MNVILLIEDRRRWTDSQRGGGKDAEISVTLNLIIFAFMTPLVQESIQPDLLQGHRACNRKQISPNHTLWIRGVRGWNIRGGEGMGRHGQKRGIRGWKYRK